MIDSNVEDFLKEELIKKLEKEEKELKKSRESKIENDEIKDLIEELKKSQESKMIENDKIKDLIKKFILNAAEISKNISCATHPCKFSNPDVNKETSPVWFLGNFSADGYVRTGNVKSSFKFDLCGSATYNPKMGFFDVSMSNGKSVLENIIDNTKEGKELLSVAEKNTEELRNRFLSVFKNIDVDCVTSSKIKQVYFQVSKGQYHLLSLLTPSLLVYELKNRLSKLVTDSKENKEKIKKGEKTNSFQEIYNLMHLKYGGSKPQNISYLNSKNGGTTRLLLCVPPTIDEINVRLPKTDFFYDCLSSDYSEFGIDFKSDFKRLSQLMFYKNNSKIPSGKIRKYQNRCLEKIIKSIIEIMLLVRENLKDIPESLKSEQQIWLNKDENVRNEVANDWKSEIGNCMALWIILKLKKGYKVELDDTDLSAVRDVISSHEELWK